MVDIDFVVTEYDNAKPAAVIEYKNESAPMQNSNHPSYRALAELCDERYPFFGVRYASDLTRWQVIPLNNAAKSWIPKQRTMSEQNYVGLLYEIRGRKLPSDILKRLKIEGIPSGVK